MSTTRLQVIQGRKDTAPPSPQIRLQAYNLYRAGRTVGQVARYMGIDFNIAADVIFEHLQWREAQAEQRGITIGRRSLLTRPTAAQRRAA